MTTRRELLGGGASAALGLLPFGNTTRVLPDFTGRWNSNIASLGRRGTRARPPHEQSRSHSDKGVF
jgi:hypothetical protein